MIVRTVFDKDKPTFLKLAEQYHDPVVEDGVQNSNGGTAVFRKVAPVDLHGVTLRNARPARLLRIC